MPSYVVTAVDITANTLTAAGVAPLVAAFNSVPSLLTGDRFRLRNTGGALPSATPALVAGQDYWAVRVDENTIKISDTNAHALGGTGIVDLTGSGSGTTTIEYQLPYCLPTQVALGGVSQVNAVDENMTWQALNALYSMMVGQSQTVWSDVRKAFIPAGAFVVNNGTATLLDGVWSPGTSTSLTRWEYPLALPAGVSIDSLQAIYVRHSIADASDAYTLKLRQRALTVGSALPSGSDLASVQVLGDATSNYPNLDAIAVGPVAVPAATIVVVRFEAFQNSSSGTLAQFAGVVLSTTRT